MGELRDGTWHAGWYPPDKKGRFQRPPTKFRGTVPRAEPGRYHLYVSFACPWATRVILARALLGLEDAVGMTAVDPKMGDDGWQFGGEGEADPLHGARFLRELYVRADPRYTGRVTVPLLWDKEEDRAVNNESRELLRMLCTGFRELGTGKVDLSPEPLREEIDRTLDALYEPVNNGVYRAGFAATQEAYEDACRELFAALDHWDAHLSTRRYLVGGQITEADLCFFTTLVRFDLVYYAHFKCNLRRIQDYPNLWGYLRDLYQSPGFRACTRLEDIKVHYYWSQPTVNPTRIVPLGPSVPLDQPHDRARLP